MKENFKKFFGKIKNSNKKWFYLVLAAIVVIGLVFFAVQLVGETAAYNEALEDYKNHEHSSRVMKRS